MRFLLSMIMLLVLASCSAREIGTIRPAMVADMADAQGGDGCVPKTIWITIDGTANTQLSRTAAARLHEMVEAYSYMVENRQLAIWYAVGVGSGDLEPVGAALGTGVNEDIKKAYAFLTKIWRPCDRIFLNGFSRGVYSVRALGGMLYMAGIPDLSDQNVGNNKERMAIVDAIFKAYRARAAYDNGIAKQQANSLKAALNFARKGRADDPDRQGGYDNPDSKVVIEAMTVWDTVQAIGWPDQIEATDEGPDYFLITACNAKAIFQPLSLDDNRAYSFTPVLAGGPKATSICSGNGRQNVSRTIKEMWFSGAHADVGGTYEANGMLDGELASISLNWVIAQLTGQDCPDCGTMLALPSKLAVPEDRTTAIHDGKRSNAAYKLLYRQSRKPTAYWFHRYKTDTEIPVHDSVLDRLEWLFALDAITPECGMPMVKGAKPPICAQDIAANSLVPELFKRGCIEITDWGYRLTRDQHCVSWFGKLPGQDRPAPRPKPARVQKAENEQKLVCNKSDKPAYFKGMVYAKPVAQTDPNVVHREACRIPYPLCMAGHAFKDGKLTKDAAKAAALKPCSDV